MSAAVLVLSNKETGETRQTLSSEKVLQFVDLARGEHTLTVKSTGFRDLQIGPLPLSVGQALAVRRPRLDLGTVTEVGNVEATVASGVTSNMSQVVDTKRIEQPPLNGRNALQLRRPAPWRGECRYGRSDGAQRR